MIKLFYKKMYDSYKEVSISELEKIRQEIENTNEDYGFSEVVLVKASDEALYFEEQQFEC